jgi:hypothetical protein
MELTCLQYIGVKRLKNTVFWYVTPYSLVDVYGCFGGTFCLLLQGSGSKPSKQYSFILQPWTWWQYIPPKLRRTSTRQHSVAFQMIVLTIVTAMRTSNLTCYKHLFGYTFLHHSVHVIHFLQWFARNTSNTCWQPKLEVKSYRQIMFYIVCDWF